MKIISTSISKAGKKRLIIELGDRENLLPLVPDIHYKLGYPLDMIVRSDIISDAVPVSNAPTKSPIPVTPRPQLNCYPTRDEARMAAVLHNKHVGDFGPASPKGKRWYLC